jgi:hypothetical protein
VGDTLCIDLDSGGIYLYESAVKYNMVHESIDGFLLRCLVSLYCRDAFANVSVKRDASAEYSNDFKLKNAQKKLIGATCFEFEYEAVEHVEIRAEYYFIDSQLLAVYPGSGSFVTMSGGVLDGLGS